MNILWRLKKILLEHELLFRNEVQVSAAYNVDQERITLFVDGMTLDMIRNWNVWGRIAEDGNLLEFSWKFFNYLYLHETIHWVSTTEKKSGGWLMEITEIITDYLALLLTWNDVIARNISVWWHQDPPSAGFPNCIIELDGDETE